MRLSPESIAKLLFVGGTVFFLTLINYYLGVFLTGKQEFTLSFFVFEVFAYLLCNKAWESDANVRTGMEKAVRSVFRT